MFRIEDKFQRVAVVFVVVISLSAVYKWVSSYFLIANIANRVTVEYYSNALKKYSFAGEPLPFDDLKMVKRYQKELVNNSRQSTEMAIVLKRAKVWLPRIEAILKKHGLPTDFKYLAVAESYFSNNVSHMHAAGFWQIQRTTGTDLGLIINDEIDERYNPYASTEAVCKYIIRTKKQFPSWSWTDIAVSYNLGITALYNIKNKYPKKSTYHIRLNKETQVYLFRIIALKEIIENPTDYGYKNYRVVVAPYKKVIIRNSVRDLHVFAKYYGISYYTFKEFNPWLKRNTLTFSPEIKRKSFEVIIPLNTKLENHFESEPEDVTLDTIQAEPLVPSDSTIKKVEESVLTTSKKP
ncbi:MAG: lytic transglycosylase domain-containing protein [Cytophagales bacterium]|nr:lytic transglycosylase domain-containing protein [Cytophagales bacterium]